MPRGVRGSRPCVSEWLRNGCSRTRHRHAYTRTVAAQTRLRRNVAAQMVRDRDHRNWQDALVARMGAVLGAQQARADHEQDADFTFRQSLVDLAAIAELIADELPVPEAVPRFEELRALAKDG